MLGKVKWFNDLKGYGFINSSECDEDILVHYSEIQQEGYKILEKDAVVEFDLVTSIKGFQALNVVKR